jgi:N-methylhydantoinase B
MTYPQTVVDTIFKAVAPAAPDRTIAGHHADLAAGGAYGFINPVTGQIDIARGGGSGLSGGGWGAKLGEDGMTATVCINDGDTHNSPAEAGEAKAPILIRERSLRQDSGGAGEWRGGLGVMQDVVVLHAAMFDSRIERTLCPPWGLEGGKEALPNGVLVTRKDGDVQRFPTGKVNPVRLDIEDGYVILTGGGGGFGDPLRRPADKVLRDVNSGYVSVDTARRDYGVVVKPKGRLYELDTTATELLRREMAASNGRDQDGATSR